MCDSGKGETFCERSKKEQSARKISRCARNDDMGEWVYFTWRTTDMFGKRYSCIVIPSEVEGSFLHTGIASYVRQWKRGNLLRKEQEKVECKEDFSTLLEMTVWGMDNPRPVYMSRIKDMLGKRRFRNVIPSEVEGSFLQEGIMSYV